MVPLDGGVVSLRMPEGLEAPCPPRSTWVMPPPPEPPAPPEPAPAPPAPAPAPPPAPPPAPAPAPPPAPPAPPPAPPAPPPAPCANAAPTEAPASIAAVKIVRIVLRICLLLEVSMSDQSCEASTVPSRAARSSSVLDDSASILRRHGNFVEPFGESIESRAHLRPLHGRTVSGDDDLRCEGGKRTHRRLRAFPIRSEIHRRSVHLRRLRHRGVDGFLPRRDEGVAGDQHAIAFAPERDMPWGMAGRMDPPPFRHEGYAMIKGKIIEARSDVHRPCREERRKPGEQPATDAGIGRRIGLASVKIGMLGRMGIDRHLPFIRQRFENADVIEVPMRHYDAGGPAVSSESGLGGRADGASRSGDAGVHQHPIAVAGVLETDEDDVDNRKLTIGDVSDDLPRAVVAVEVGLRVLRVGGRGKRDLRHVHSGPM